MPSHQCLRTLNPLELWDCFFLSPTCRAKISRLFMASSFSCLLVAVTIWMAPPEECKFPPYRWNVKAWFCTLVFFHLIHNEKLWTSGISQRWHLHGSWYTRYFSKGGQRNRTMMKAVKSKELIRDTWVFDPSNQEEKKKQRFPFSQSIRNWKTIPKISSRS